MADYYRNKYRDVYPDAPYVQKPKPPTPPSSPPAADDRAARASLVDELQALRTVQYECNECSVFDRVFEIVARHETTWQARMQAAESLAIGADLLVKQLESSWNVERDRADTAQSLLVSMRDQRDALAAFKSFVHGRLDTAGVPTHPDGPHSTEGCRIGDRLDIVIGERAEAAVERVRQLTDGIAEIAIMVGGESGCSAWTYAMIGQRLAALLRPSPPAALPAAGDDDAERAAESAGLRYLERRTSNP